jgi:hypothetical protein
MIDRLSYRPGWWFSAPQPGVIRVHWDSPNSLNPSANIILFADVDVTGMSPADTADAVYRKIADVEAHERAEWFRVDGQTYDPEAVRAHPGREFHPVWDRDA